MKADTTPHRQFASAAFAIAGAYYGYMYARDFDSIWANLRSFFDYSPEWQIDAAAGALALVPLSFVAVAVAVYRDTKGWVAVIPAAIAILFTFRVSSIVLGVYLVLYYSVFKTSRDSGPTDA